MFCATTIAQAKECRPILVKQVHFLGDVYCIGLYAKTFFSTTFNFITAMIMKER